MINEFWLAPELKRTVTKSKLFKEKRNGRNLTINYTLDDAPEMIIFLGVTMIGYLG